MHSKIVRSVLFAMRIKDKSPSKLIVTIGYLEND